MTKTDESKSAKSSQLLCFVKLYYTNEAVQDA